MRFTDQDVVAYVDGELPADRAKTIADACASDAELAGRVNQLRESRDILKTAFAAKLSEPVPDRLLAVLREAPSAKVVAMPSRAPRSRVWIPMALAASIALAVGVALRWQAQPGAPAGNVAMIDDRLIQESLDRNVSGETQRISSAEIMPTASLIDAQGRYCREYEATTSAHKLRAIACHDADRGWVTQVATRDVAASASGGGDEYQPASGASEDLTKSLGNVTQLTPAEEQSAIEKGWGARTK